MTQSQLFKIQSLTHRLARRYDNMSFSVQECGKVIVFCANNLAELPWYETEQTLYAFIGPRGGFEKYAGTITL